MLSGNGEGAQLFGRVGLAVGKEVGHHVEVGVVGGVGEGGCALGAAGVALLAGEGIAFTKVTEEHAATALCVGEGILLHGLDAVCVFFFALFVYGGGDDDAVGVDAFLCEGDGRAGSARDIMYHARAIQSEQRFVEGFEVDTTHVADVLLVDEDIVAEYPAVEA